MTIDTHLKDKGDGTFNPNAHYGKTHLDPAASERDYNTALAVMAEAVKSFKDTPTDLALQMRCEALWIWLKAENWTPPPIALVAPQPSATPNPPSATAQDAVQSKP
jgi:hypothetical protein